MIAFSKGKPILLEPMDNIDHRTQLDLPAEWRVARLSLSDGENRHVEGTSPSDGFAGRRDSCKW